MSKKLTANTINNLAKTTFIKKEINVLIEDKNFPVLIETKFRESLLAKAIFEMVARSNYCRENNIELDNALNMQICILKYFTDLPFPKFKEDNIEKVLSQEVVLMTNMLDLGIYEQVMNSFNKNEINKLNDMMKKYSKEFTKLSENFIYQEKFALNNIDKLDGEELLEQIKGEE